MTDKKEAPLGIDCTNCKCATCAYDCQYCVHRDDWLPDCRLFLMTDCDYYIEQEELDELLDS